MFKHKFLEGDIEHIKQQLWKGSVATAVVNSVALGNCTTVEKIKEFLRNSLTWKIYSSEADNQENQESKRAFHSQRDTWQYRISDDIGNDIFLLIENLVNPREVDEYLLTKCIRNSYAYQDYIGILPNRELEQKAGGCFVHHYPD